MIWSSTLTTVPTPAGKLLSSSFSPAGPGTCHSVGPAADTLPLPWGDLGVGETPSSPRSRAPQAGHRAGSAYPASSDASPMSQNRASSYHPALPECTAGLHARLVNSEFDCKAEEDN